MEEVVVVVVEMMVRSRHGRLQTINININIILFLPVGWHQATAGV